MISITAFLVVLAASAQMSSAWTRSQWASAYIYRRSRNPYVRAYALANLMRRPNTNQNNNTGSTAQGSSVPSVQGSVQARICPESIRNSFYKFCQSSLCNSQPTRNSCCMLSYPGNDGTTAQQCRCEPSVTCGGGATSGQQPGQTEQRSTSLCPQVEHRTLSSSPVAPQDRCQFGGVANLTSLNGQTVTCNAVLTRANVNGVTKITFLTTLVCTHVVDALADNPDTGLEMSMGDQTFSLSQQFTTVKGPHGSAFLDIPAGNTDIINSFSQCLSPACAFDESTMSGQVNTQECKMVSYGASDSVTFEFEGKHQLDLRQNPSGCTTLPDLFEASNTLCFESTSGEDVFCVGDSGAPVYCKAPSTNEWILMGVTALQTHCGGNSELKVIPVPV